MPIETVFDATGSVYNGDLLISFSHSIYRINPDGQYSLVLDTPQLQNYEGLIIIPNNPSRYGTLAGTMLIPQTGDTIWVGSKYNSPSGGANAGRSFAVVGLDKSVPFLPIRLLIFTRFLIYLLLVTPILSSLLTITINSMV